MLRNLIGKLLSFDEIKIFEYRREKEQGKTYS